MGRAALICGATGIVGKYLVEILAKPDHPEGPWKVYAVGRRPTSEAELCIRTSNYIYVQCDLQNKDETYQKLSPLKDITHIFWVTWQPRISEVDTCDVNGSMFSNTLDAVVPNAAHLQHICLQTGIKEYVGSFEQMAQAATGNFVAHAAPFKEDMPRLPGPNFYHTLEDLLFDTVKKSARRLTYSIHRPTVIIGFTIGTVLNAFVSIIVYGVICGKLGLPFEFSGDSQAWEVLGDMVTGELVAEQEIWAATDPKAHNQAFNCTNGDLFTWKRTWPVIAEELGLEQIPFKGSSFSLTEKMQGMGPVWEAIVREHNLLPTKIDQVANFTLLDGWWKSPMTNISCTNKLKEFGFLAFRNSETAVRTLIRELVQTRLIPPLAPHA